MISRANVWLSLRRQTKEKRLGGIFWPPVSCGERTACGKSGLCRQKEMKSHTTSPWKGAVLCRLCADGGCLEKINCYGTESWSRRGKRDTKG